MAVMTDPNLKEHESKLSIFTKSHMGHLTHLHKGKLSSSPKKYRRSVKIEEGFHDTKQYFVTAAP